MTTNTGDRISRLEGAYDLALRPTVLKALKHRLALQLGSLILAVVALTVGVLRVWQ